MNIRTKMLLGAATLALVPVVITGALIGQGAFSNAKSSLSDETRAKLVAIRDNKRDQISEYVSRTSAEIQGLAGTTTVVEAMRGFQAAFASAGADNGGEAKADQWRVALSDYYTKEFGAEFGKRNLGSVPDFSAIVAKLNPNALALQYQYIVQNEHPLGQKNRLAIAHDGSAYSKVHAQYHQSLEAFRDKLGFYDLFLVDPATSQVLYTVFKEIDFASNLSNGVAAKSKLAEAVQAVSKAKGRDDVSLSDYAVYLASYNAQAAFVAAPVFDGDRQIGVLAAQVPLDRISAVMTSNKKWAEAGLGTTGETYLIGLDKTLRSESRFFLENKQQFLESLKSVATNEQIVEIDRKGSTIGHLKIDTEGTRQALAGKTGVLAYKDYRGQDVVGAFAPLSVQGLQWGLLAEQDAAEVLAPVRKLATSTAIRTALTSLLVLGAVMAIALYVVNNFMRRLINPINQLQSTVQKVAAGDFTARANIKTGDEMETLGNTLDNLLDDRIAALAKAEKENEQLNNSVIALLQTVNQLSQRDLTARAPVTEDVIGTVSDSINQLATETSEVLQQVTQIATLVDKASQQVKVQADLVAKTAQSERQGLGVMIEDLGLATTAMTKVITLAETSNEAASKAIETTQTAERAVSGSVRGMNAIRDTIGEVEKRIKRLGERSQEITSIVNLINTIAERTHVLALNASMQAAVAGEAGRGFAVVAEEVQRLAESSRNATSQIANLVHNIQIETGDTIATVNKTIDQVVQGSELVQRSGDQMRETQETTTQLVQLVQQIAQSAQEQARIVDALQTSVRAIGSSTEQTATQLQTQGRITETLVTAARRLLEAVSVFKLPAAAKA